MNRVIPCTIKFNNYLVVMEEAISKVEGKRKNIFDGPWAEELLSALR